MRPPAIAAERIAVAEGAPPLVHALSQEISIALAGQSLETALGRISDTFGVTFWCDRRVDPHQRLQISVVRRPLGEAIEQIASQLQLAAAPWHNLVYLGPPESAARLTADATRLRDSLRYATGANRRRWRQSKPWDWPALSEPRKLLQTALEATGTSLADPALVPHDLWGAGSTPPLTPIEQTTLLLAGFELHAELAPDGKRLLVHSHRLGRPGRPHASPQPPPSPATDQAGPSSRPAAGAATDTAPRRNSDRRDFGRQVISLKVENQPLGRVLQHLTRQLGLDLRWRDPEFEQQVRDRLVSCDMHQVGVDELFQALLEPAQGSHRRTGDVVEIGPREGPPRKGESAAHESAAH
jgi:hypothetical protein